MAENSIEWIDAYLKPSWQRHGASRRGEKVTRKTFYPAGEGAETFLADVYAEWETGGKQAIKKMAKDRSADFCRMVASLMPKELKVNENPFADLSDSELQAFIDLCRVMAEGTAPEDEADAPGLPHCNDGEAD